MGPTYKTETRAHVCRFQGEGAGSKQVSHLLLTCPTFSAATLLRTTRTVAGPVTLALSEVLFTMLRPIRKPHTTCRVDTGLQLLIESGYQHIAPTFPIGVN